MKYITITCEPFDFVVSGNRYTNDGTAFYRTECEVEADITRWVNEWALEWRYSTVEEIAAHGYDYFNPYVGETNESTWQ